MKVRTLASFARYVDQAILAPSIGAVIDVDDEVGESLVNAGLAEKVAAKAPKTPADRRQTKVTAPRETKVTRPRRTKAAEAVVAAVVDPDAPGDTTPAEVTDAEGTPIPPGPDGLVTLTDTKA